MGSSSDMLRMVAIVMIVVGILIIVQSAWNLWFINSSNGDDCACSGVSDGDKMCLQVFNGTLIVLGAILAFWALWILSGRTNEKSGSTSRRRQRFSTDQI